MLNDQFPQNSLLIKDKNNKDLISSVLTSDKGFRLEENRTQKNHEIRRMFSKQAPSCKKEQSKGVWEDVHSSSGSMLKELTVWVSG